jgi:hypothetical protein
MSGNTEKYTIYSIIREFNVKINQNYGKRAIAPMMETAGTSETSVNLQQTALCKTPEEGHIHTYGSEDLKFQLALSCRLVSSSATVVGPCCSDERTLTYGFEPWTCVLPATRRPGTVDMKRI